MKLIPFDKAKAQAGAKVFTADGRSVRLLCYDRNAIQCIVGLVKNINNDRESMECWRYDGRNIDNFETSIDLRIGVEPKEYEWIRARDGEGILISRVREKENGRTICECTSSYDADLITKLLNEYEQKEN